MTINFKVPEIKELQPRLLVMGIYGILWVLELKVNTYYLGTIIVLVIMKIDTST